MLGKVSISGYFSPDVIALECQFQMYVGCVSKSPTVSETWFLLSENAYLDLPFSGIMCRHPLTKNSYPRPHKLCLRRLSGWLISIGTTTVDPRAGHLVPDTR
jgi:hypothetical protein